MLEAIHVQPKTGATVGFVEWVYVVPTGGEPRGKPVFIADKVDGPLRLSWAGNSLTITAERARVFKAAATSSVHGPQGDVNSTLRVVVEEPVT